MSQVSERFETIPLGAIAESKTNPRKTFDKARLQELADSIAAKGVVQPIVVRAKGKAKYEIVAGSRRFRASKLAGVDTIPAMIRDLTDDEVLEIQIIENAQREDIDPYEEALGYKALLDRGVLDIGAIASKVAKSEGTIKRRLLLSRLDPKVYATLVGQHAPIAAMELIAALPVEEQPEGAEYWTKDLQSWNPPSMAGFRQWLRGRHPLLERATWELGDATLLPQAGACTSCPCNTAAPATLFPEPDKDPRCMRPKCFETKAAAMLEGKIADAKARGLTLLSGSYSGAVGLSRSQWEHSKAKDAGYGIIIESYNAADLWKEVRFKRIKAPAGSNGHAGGRESKPDMAARREQLRGYRAEMIARRRILDAVLALLDEDGDYIAGRLDGDVGYRSALALSALLRGPGTPNVVTSKDPPNGKHPGIDEEWEKLGFTDYFSRHKASPEDLQKIEMAPETFVRVQFLAATRLEIHVEDSRGYHANHPPLVLTAAANALSIDMEAIRKQADFDTLSKKAQKERLAENTAA